MTTASLQFGELLAQTVIVEKLFSWPGLGYTIYQAVEFRDYPVLQGAFLIITILVILSNFLAEIIYGLAAPRVRTQSNEKKSSHHDSLQDSMRSVIDSML